MRDVAALAGVSQKTVSRVVNDEPKVSQEARERVETAIAQLSYRPDQRAGSLRRNTTSDTIGVVVSSVANPFAAAVNRAIENEAATRGVAVLASSTDDNPEREQPTVEALLRRRVDGLVITASLPNQGYLHAEQSFGTPLVFVDRAPTGIEADVVMSDHEKGAAVGTRHLVEHGHRRIAYLGDLDSIQSARSRRAGFLAEIGRHGIPTGDCHTVMGVHDEATATAAAISLLDLAEPPTAIFSSQNLLTVGVIKALRQRGLERTVALVGFDDLPLADLLAPALTVVAQNPERIGALAADLLFDRLDGTDTPTKTHIIPTELIPRGSGEIHPATA
nr:LacI family DNA-binding transcriptional regulator [Luteimicrobium album]